VVKNDQISLEEIDQYDKIVLSPGPGIPEEAGILLDLIKEYAPTKSILGVCLGQQAIAEAFGGSLTNLSEIFHGVATSADFVKEDTKFLKIYPAELKSEDTTVGLLTAKICRKNWKLPQ
jgi:anthranilate synthase component 2